MANADINNNIFYTITNDADSIGLLTGISPDIVSDAINMQFSAGTFSHSSFNITKDPSFKLLRVVNEDSLTNYSVNFVTNPDFRRADNLKDININFVDVVDSGAVSDLINLLNLSKITSSNGTQANISVLISDIEKSLNLFPQSQLTEPYNAYISEISQKISEDQATVNGYPSLSPTQKAIIDLDALKSKIILNQTNLDFMKKFSGRPNALTSKVSGNFNKFSADFRSQFQTVYDQLVKSGQITDATSRTKSSDVIGSETTPPTSPGLSVDPTNQALTKQANTILGSNQIIDIVSQSGTNVFGPHQPFDQTMSILDVMRNENAGVSYTSNINVQQNIGQGTETGDVSSVCSKLYSNFSVSDINNMIKSLENKLTVNSSTTQKLLIAIKRIQGNGNFQFMNAFSGFGGINFSSLDASNLGSLDFDSLLDGAKKGIKSIASLVVNDVGGAYGQIVSEVTGAVTNQAKNLYNNTVDSMNSINFKRALDGIDPDVLRKCPSLSKIKSIMQNPDAAVSEQLAKTKQNVNQTTKAYQNNVQELQQTVQENTSLQEQITALQSILAQKNP